MLDNNLNSKINIFTKRQIKEIKEILNSEEYKNHPELFTSTTLAHAKISEIKELFPNSYICNLNGKVIY